MDQNLSSTSIPKIAEDEDKKMTDSWKADADSVLVFVGIEVLLVEIYTRTNSILDLVYSQLLLLYCGDLRPSSQGTSAFYLQNIYQLLSDPNVSNLIHMDCTTSETRNLDCTSAAFHICLARQEHPPSTRRSLLSFRSYLQRSLTLYGNNFSTTPIVCSIRYV